MPRIMPIDGEPGVIKALRRLPCCPMRACATWWPAAAG